MKSETSAHAQLAITSLYILFTNFTTWCKLETYIKDTLCLIGPIDDLMNKVA